MKYRTTNEYDVDDAFLDRKNGLEHDVYEADYVDRLLEDDALSFEEAAFMSGYSDFS